MKISISSLTKVRYLFILIVSVSLVSVQFALAAEGRWIKVGNLHNFYQSHGSEPEQDYGDEQQYGLRWNALYDHQDIQAAKGFWIGVKNFQDPVAGVLFPYKVAHVGPRPRPDIENNEFMPVEFGMKGRFLASEVYVNGSPASDMPYSDLIDVGVDSDLAADRIIYNKVNSSTGITMERRIYGLSQQNYNDFIITEYVFANTGICNSDGSITHSQTLEDTYFHWQYRNAIAGEGTVDGSQIDWRGRRGWGTPQNSRWGMNTMNDVIGEDPDNPVTESLYAEMGEMGIDEFDDNGNIMRAYYSWHGRHSVLGYDNIGSPNYQGWLPDGMLGASQFAGAVVLHADTSPTNSTDDVYQPSTTQIIESNDPATTNNNQYSSSRMEDEYLRLISAGHPALSHAEAVQSANTYPDQFAIAGGYSQSWSFGPYSLEPGDSVRIVIAEAVSGLSRNMNHEVGNNWYRTVALGESPDLVMPDGSPTTDANEYKNAWVYSGRDSLMQTFRRARSAWEVGLNNIPNPPPPPSVFEVVTGHDQIILNWDDSAENYVNFSGYRLYRAMDSYNRIFEKVFECGPGTSNSAVVNTWLDLTVIPNVPYFYYLVAVDDGSQNVVNAGIPLESGKFWTLTSRPVMSSDSPVVNADLYVSPTGDDSNTGLSASDPLRTISWASEMMISSPLNLNTIHLAPGVYSTATTGETFPLKLNNFFILKGDSLDWAFLDAGDTARVIDLDNLIDVQLENLFITNGFALSGGGGIRSISSSGKFSNLVIEANSVSAGSGGGIYCGRETSLELANVTIRNNHAVWGGGYFNDPNSKILLSEIERCNIYLNTAEGAGDDIYETGLSTTYLTVDTFTVLTPSDYHAYGKQIEIDILNSKIPQINNDLFVSPVGNNENTGLAEGQAFKTIEMALKSIYADSINSHVIHLAAGTYSPSGNSERFPLHTRSFVSLLGENPRTTILDAENSQRIFNIWGDSLLELESLMLTGGSTVSGGGAIYCRGASDISLNSLDITNNYASRGGGIYFASSPNVSLANVNIHHNNAETGGGGIYVRDAVLSFDTDNRCDIYLNESTEGGDDLHSFSLFSPLNNLVVLDTFTVTYPTEQYAFPLGDFTFDILNSIIFQSEADLYVSPTGNDANSGLTTNDPLKTIARANELIFGDVDRPHTIHLASGVYSASSNGETLPIQARSYISLVGDPEGGTVLDGENMTQVIVGEDVIKVNVSDLTIQGGVGDNGGGVIIINSDSVSFTKVTIQDNSVKYDGAGIHATYSSVTVEDAIFRHNTARYGAGIATFDSEVNVSRSLFHDDSSSLGAALFLNASSSFLDQLTIADNKVVGLGGAITLRESGKTTLKNSICWNNGDRSLFLYTNTALSVLHSDIQGGISAVVGDSIYFLDGNIDLDPLFCHPKGEVYSLAENSPCIAAGENGVNMGALDIGCTVSIDEQAMLPMEHTLYQNFPNPFNPVTTIRYGLKENTQVSLTIYDITGKTVIELEERDQVAGWYNFSWSGIDQRGRQMSTGVYFCRLQAGSYSKTIKMVFLK